MTEEKKAPAPSEPVIKPKKKTKAQIKKERKKQIKEMEEHVKAHGELVQASICKSCIHCSNRSQEALMFYTTDSKGNKIPFYPMNRCSITAIAMVDVKECELYTKEG